MKSEFATPKDLEKLRVELASKAGGGKLDPTHPDMGPIMDSLIMTSKSSLFYLLILYWILRRQTLYWLWHHYSYDWDWTGQVWEVHCNQQAALGWCQRPVCYPGEGEHTNVSVTQHWFRSLVCTPCPCRRSFKTPPWASRSPATCWSARYSAWAPGRGWWAARHPALSPEGDCYRWDIV